MILNEDDVEDKDILFHRRFDKMQRNYLKTLVCDEIIEEHRTKPLGQHGEPLERLLIYFRRRQHADKYVVKRERQPAIFKLAKVSGVRGAKPQVIEDETYETVEDAYHGVFLKYVDELMRS